MPVRWKRKGVPQEAAGELQRVGSRLTNVGTLVALVAAAAAAGGQSRRRGVGGARDLRGLRQRAHRQLRHGDGACGLRCPRPRRPLFHRPGLGCDRPQLRRPCAQLHKVWRTPAWAAAMLHPCIRHCVRSVLVPASTEERSADYRTVGLLWMA